MRSEINRLPEEFLGRLKQVFPAHKYHELVNLFAVERPTTFRINPLKAPSVEIVREKLNADGFQIHPVSWCPGAFVLQKGRLRDLQKTAVYENGQIYVQALSSMVPPLILNPQPGEKVLDLAAAPGSKTTQMAAMMQGDGELVANDNNQVRFFKLKANLKTQGCDFVKTTLSYGESFGRKYPNYFDRVLLDVPCSSEGRFLVSDPASFKYWKPRKVKEMQQKQKKLLHAALSALRPGGLLLYSTCTFAPEENEGVIDWALKKFTDMLEMMPIKLSFPNHVAGLMGWQGKPFLPGVRQSVRILPNNYMEGFYLACLRKK
ncbi:MAG: hypothetical protein COV74_08715 [Candidatus Omnitrophica bacterium CG11_big_fil_rev_8_21_14_0_20_45_26]|uniref:SAM-dependent MTase RsmB/NOP-type domain-containing protein n=1 Tax=Candidatus Abzuiibacterium crystallinum TaxID=1974748 RepID=A0A2H0LMH5_9BACT|nr:MAG: hypothetical protein COV74_08715 [Candidatus Omnitrophica bacterium CG11_big_fil_rev_8_21_14_0_20_45_26]PIW63742.1 MAG: hypothetical protein COW12_09600 [Candidatus Omnitrophica bacterium CG12_big_fil_rev_8_21_14_0_65_45_16]